MTGFIEGYDRLPRWLRRRSDLTWTAKGVYAFLAHWSKHGRRSPGARLIAEECGTTRNAVRRALEALEAAELLVVEKEGSRSPRYVVLAPRGETDRVQVVDRIGRTPKTGTGFSTGSESTPVVTNMGGCDSTPPTGSESTPGVGSNRPPNRGRSEPTEREERELRERGERGGARETPPDPKSIWEYFDGQWAAHHGELAGLFSAHQQRDVEQLLAKMSPLELRADIEAFCRAPLKRKSHPWRQFTDQAGSWRRRELERTEAATRAAQHSAEEDRRLAQALPSPEERIDPGELERLTADLTGRLRGGGAR